MLANIGHDPLKKTASIGVRGFNQESDLGSISHGSRRIRQGGRRMQSQDGEVKKRRLNAHNIMASREAVWKYSCKSAKLRPAQQGCVCLCTMRKKSLIVLLCAACALPVWTNAEERELRVLFLGDKGAHRPEERFKQLQPALRDKEIELTYTDSLSSLSSAAIARKDSGEREVLAKATAIVSGLSARGESR